MALEPLQAPDAVQEVAFDELQLKVLLPPVFMVIGEALRLTVGDDVVELLIGISNKYSDPGSSVLVKLVEEVEMLVVGILPTGVFCNI